MVRVKLKYALLFIMTGPKAFFIYMYTFILNVIINMTCIMSQGERDVRRADTFASFIPRLVQKHRQGQNISKQV